MNTVQFRYLDHFRLIRKWS